MIYNNLTTSGLSGIGTAILRKYVKQNMVREKKVTKLTSYKVTV
jgi:hypothetical protein